ncbi:DUF2530 domain-containing protein [Cellulomonas denverensis]|uniref:DUF2530 domain-containing protein n=1 Tax=Cellulomonas denverensis TaxID=264297 RepID=A0A7X6KV79_9CELL|nr:DUF2530 domain-containing protein [Cellulomonas denverensis]NKY22874.1 DUF2530 domain-containing protein [Cellulomonas denverensis]GIG24054.1 hypothetical protein Cde04nite_02980 [Cellulomonas denverensis]
MPSFLQLALRPERRRPSPEPVPVSLRPVFRVGIAVWLVALVVALVLWLTGTTGPHGAWTCGVGALLGVAGLLWARKPGR